MRKEDELYNSELDRTQIEINEIISLLDRLKNVLIDIRTKIREEDVAIYYEYRNRINKILDVLRNSIVCLFERNYFVLDFYVIQKNFLSEQLSFLMEISKIDNISLADLQNNINIIRDLYERIKVVETYFYIDKEKKPIVYNSPEFYKDEIKNLEIDRETLLDKLSIINQELEKEKAQKKIN